MLPHPEGTQPCAITGLGVYRPRRVVENAEIAPRHGVDAHWVEARAGIQARHHAEPDETLVAMAAQASSAALQVAGIGAGQVDCVVLTTMSNVRQVPALAPALAHTLGCTRAGAFDLNAACAGFTYGLTLARALIGARNARHILVVATERMTDLIDPGDRATALVFGDGAGAVVVSASQEVGIGPVSWGNDGSGEKLFTLQPDFTRLDADHPRPYVHMDGTRLAHIFPRITRELAHRALADNELSWKDLGAFIPHQANLRLNAMCLAGIDLPGHVAVATAITRDGNTSSASIPLAIHRLLADHQARPGDLALLVGYGVGLTWSAMVVRLPKAGT
ncbi:3-oxoacyl-ACP synthase III family protein [Streptomyces sp. NPDC101227]|uniref:3-oxoacyl-ACP synthase III family protein n=1 Tax=Streptomyces sp. NPDC101227 TaxID=3366136 RepID=UPI00382BBF4D